MFTLVESVLWFKIVLGYNFDDNNALSASALIQIRVCKPWDETVFSRYNVRRPFVGTARLPTPQKRT